MFAAGFGKDLKALLGEEGIRGSLAERLGYRLLATVQVVTASYQERSWCWPRGEGHSIYNYHPWATWPLHGGNERLRFHQGNIFSCVCGCEFQL